jgi:hypothetical protein
MTCGTRTKRVDLQKKVCYDRGQMVQKVAQKVSISVGIKDLETHVICQHIVTRMLPEILDIIGL